MKANHLTKRDYAIIDRSNASIKARMQARKLTQRSQLKSQAISKRILQRKIRNGIISLPENHIDAEYIIELNNEIARYQTVISQYRSQIRQYKKQLKTRIMD